MQTSSLGLGSTLVRSRLGAQTSSLGLGSSLVRSRLDVQTSALGLEKCSSQDAHVMSTPRVLAEDVPSVMAC